MPETKLPDFSLLLAVIASIFGATTITALLLQPVNYHSDFNFTPTLIGSLYVAICVLGICAVFYPKKCQRTFMFQKGIKSSIDQPVAPKTVQYSGHHPNCTMFSANRIEIRKTVLCAACSGLLVGAVVALVGAVFYFFVAYNFLWSDPWILVVSNFGMLLGLFQFKFASYVKLGVNALFVFSSFVMLVMADQLGKNPLIDLYVLGLIVFFLATRILLSEFYNKRTCGQCKQCF
jgi:hypothetical protein